MAPSERLWQSLVDLFDDKETSHAGPDVGFDALSGVDVLRVWDYLSARTKSVDDDPVVWDTNNEDLPNTPPLTEAVALLARGELGYVKVALNGVESNTMLLPELMLELWPDAVSMYWWVGTGWWDAETVGAFADLLGQLRGLVPHARLAYEQPDTEEFWGPVNSYVATMRRVREGLV